MRRLGSTVERSARGVYRWRPYEVNGVMPFEQKIRVAVVVLGDVGRSPRMQYHALALADAGADVDLIGYAGTDLSHALRVQPRIHCHLLRSPLLGGRHRLPRLLFLRAALLRVAGQSLRLLQLLFALPRPDCILVQNPPAIPTLVTAWIVARLRSASLVIDWHNFGYAMLALRVGPAHPAVRLARWYERVAGRRADAHLCVSRAMQAELAQHWGIAAAVLYDRPAAGFAPTPMELRRDLFRRLAPELALPPPGYLPNAPDRPALIVSSTSWTADEDFDLLLDALVRCEALLQARAAAQRVPQLLVLITGQGPLRAQYEERIRRLSLRSIQLRTLWLSPEDYPLLVGAADLGLCLHRSACGLDLPMKVADMFGAGLPVCALDYGPCLAEQVRPGETGLLFAGSAALAEQLYDVFKGFPDDTPLLDRLRRNVEARRAVRWSDGWKAEAEPVFAKRNRP